MCIDVFFDALWAVAIEVVLCVCCSVLMCCWDLVGFLLTCCWLCDDWCRMDIDLH